MKKAYLVSIIFAEFFNIQAAETALQGMLPRENSPEIMSSNSGQSKPQFKRPLKLNISGAQKQAAQESSSQFKYSAKMGEKIDPRTNLPYTLSDRTNRLKEAQSKFNELYPSTGLVSEPSRRVGFKGELTDYQDKSQQQPEADLGYVTEQDLHDKQMLLSEQQEALSNLQEKLASRKRSVKTRQLDDKLVSASEYAEDVDATRKEKRAMQKYAYKQEDLRSLRAACKQTEAAIKNTKEQIERLSHKLTAQNK